MSKETNKPSLSLGSTLNFKGPSDPVVKNLPSNVGNTGSIPGHGTKIPHTAGQLSP